MDLKGILLDDNIISQDKPKPNITTQSQDECIIHKYMTEIRIYPDGQQYVRSYFIGSSKQKIGVRKKNNNKKKIKESKIDGVEEW